MRSIKLREGIPAASVGIPGQLRKTTGLVLNCLAVKNETYIPVETTLPEITIKVVVLAILLSAILGVANAYLALKIGLLTSASIPAAIISMGVLRFFKNSNILENNLVQTAASAGEAVAGGIVYTLPALIMIGYWQQFSYWDTLLIALLGGMLGVLFSVPLRHVLVTEPKLHFPEGVAIAEVLKISSEKIVGIRDLIWGGLAGAFLELSQTGFKIVASTWEFWMLAGKSLIGFGAGFSPAMVGAGYLVGFNISISIFIGAILGWLIGIPVVSHLSFASLTGSTPHEMVVNLWHMKNSYIGIGAMLFAGVWTFLTLMRPFYRSLRASFIAYRQDRTLHQVIRTERDIPIIYVFCGIVLVLVALYYLFSALFPLPQFASVPWLGSLITWSSLIYILIVGFIFCAITGYFSGMVGVTATPGSAIIIAGILFATLILKFILEHTLSSALTASDRLAAEAITIMIGAVITGAAAITNDNIQDLKVGYILGATPWKQQVMLMLGVVVSAIVIPIVMQLMFTVYGIGNVLPHPGMDPAQSLPAPPAALMAAITQAVLRADLPWEMMIVGGIIILMALAVNAMFLSRGRKLSLLGLAIGMYLPLASSMPLFVGGLIAWLVKRTQRRAANRNQELACRHRGTLLACGLVAGAALMDVCMAIPFSIAHSPDALALVSSEWDIIGKMLALASTLGLAFWFYRIVHLRGAAK